MFDLEELLRDRILCFDFKRDLRHFTHPCVTQRSPEQQTNRGLKIRLPPVFESNLLCVQWVSILILIIYCKLFCNFFRHLIAFCFF